MSAGSRDGPVIQEAYFRRSGPPEEREAGIHHFFYAINHKRQSLHREPLLYQVRLFK
jgi:hypothetical protein